MTPQVWLHRQDDIVMRTVQRKTEEGIEVLLVGSTGEHAHRLFASAEEALTFREALHSRIQQRGFTLAWTTGG